jgi:hypothetical protein
MLDDSRPESGESAETPGLIFVADASAEAERLTVALRARGYPVLDVPLGLLMSRVAVQRPVLVLLDIDSLGALDVCRDLKASAGNPIRQLLIGDASRTLETQRDAVAELGDAAFPRPVDVNELLRRVEALIGPAPEGGDGNLMLFSQRPAMLVASARKPYRYEGKLATTAKKLPSVPPEVQRAMPSAPPSARSDPPRSEAAPSSAPSYAPRASKSAEDAYASLAVVPELPLSPDLASILSNAEHAASSATPAAARRLSPDQEVDALLPSDVLDSLDEPLELDDDDDDEQGDGPGTKGSGESRTGDTRTGARRGTASGSEPGPIEIAAPPRRLESNPPISRPAWSSARSTTAVDSAGAPGTERGSHPPSGPAGSLGTIAGAESVPPTSNQPVTSNQGAPSQALSSDARPEQISTIPPRPGAFESSRDSVPSDAVDSLSPPLTPPNARQQTTMLREGDGVRQLADAVGSRRTGSLAFEDTEGIRRVVFRDGDFVTAASSVERESLLAFLVKKGDLSPEAATSLGRRVPPFGRHAGAALVAHGHVRQDDLWNLLRNHAEWVITRILSISTGEASWEESIPGRLRDEPAVFGGSTGAEILVELVRRVVDPPKAEQRLGGREVRLGRGERANLLPECALGSREFKLMEEAAGQRIASVLEAAGGPEIVSVIYALFELGVFATARSIERPQAAAAPSAGGDAVDDEAMRSRILQRKALVDEGDYFTLLGIGRDATGYDVRRAYLDLKRDLAYERALSARTADLRTDLDLVHEVLDEAYEILHDQTRRERYRKALEGRF